MLCLWWWDRYTESRWSYQAAKTWCWEPVIHYRWQLLDLCCAVLLQRRLSYRLQHIKVKLHSSWLTNIKQNIKTAAFCTNWWHFFDLCSYIWPCVLKKMLSASTSSFVLWFHSRWVCICNKGGGWWGWWGWWGIWEAFWDWICDFPLGSNSGQTLSAFMQIRKGQLKALKHTRDNSLKCLSHAENHTNNKI